MKKQKLIFFIIFISILVISFNFLRLPDVVDIMENSFYKYLVKLNIDDSILNKDFYKKFSDEVIIVMIDDFSEQKISQNPNFERTREQWPRKTIAQIHSFIEKGQPKAIANDLLFEGKEDNGVSDKALVNAFKNSKNTLTGISMVTSKRTMLDEVNKKVRLSKKLSSQETDDFFIKSAHINSSFLPQKFCLNIDDSELNDTNLINNITYYRFNNIYEPIKNSTKGIGILNVPFSDVNNVIEVHKPIFKHVTKNGYRYYPSMPLATLLSTLSEKEKKPFKITNNKIIIGKRVIPIDKNGNFLINWHGSKLTYNCIPVYKVLFSSAYREKQLKNIDKNDLISPEIFKNKIVILGKITKGTDLHTTPLSMEYPGPEVQATCLDNLLNDTNPAIKNRKKLIQKANLWQNIAFALLLLTAIGVYNIKQKESHLILTWSFLWALALILFVIMAFFYFRIWFSWAYPMIALITFSTLIYVKRINELNTEKKEIEDVFGHYVSPQVLQKVLSDRSVSLTPNRKYLTVIFADIRGFTTLSEQYKANELIPQLNEYFDEMYNIIIEHDGTMDKFIGDAVMAFWGDPLPFEDHAIKAVKASKEMMKTVIKLNMKWKREGKPQLKIGIGINTGEMIVGPMGASRMVNYTVFGDSVNLASRIESLNKTYDTSILIGEETYECIKDDTQATYVDEVIVKGKNQSVKIYKII